MKYKACIFDLDGTLVNSIASLVYCTNQALERFQLGPLNEVQVKRIVGDGYQMQMRRALYAAGDEGLSHLEEILPIYMEVFSQGCLYQMKPYEGIRDFLAAAKERGMKLAVVSNKPDAQTLRVVEYVFGRECFDLVMGASEKVPKKPDPTGALSAAAEFGVLPEECLYIGDTETDMKTGKNAKMATVGVLWGFRSRETLAACRPDFLAESPLKLLELL